MKNIIAITFGTSDIQFYEDELGPFELKSKPEKGKTSYEIVHKEKTDIRLPVKENRNRKDSYLLLNAREGGQIILEHFELFLPVLQLPLTLPVIDKIKEKHPEIHTWFLVSTDQPLEQGKEHHWKGDTLYFAKIFEKNIKQKYPEEQETKFIHHYINEGLTDIDRQYLEFNKKFPEIFSLPETEINQIFLLPQGGIDQINQALTLQLIQAYKTKVKQWQKAEDEEPRELKFTALFLRDLNKQKILKHLDDFDFGLIWNMKDDIDDPKIIELAEFAHKKLNLDYQNLNSSIKYYEENSAENRAKDLYLYAKIFIKKGDYSNFVWRLFTLLENIYRMRVDEVFGNTEGMLNEAKRFPLKNKWLEKIESISGLKDFLRSRKIGRKKLDWEYPNRFAYKHIYNYLIEKQRLNDSADFQNRLNFVFNKSKPLTEKRNDIAHYLRPITLEIIEDALPNGVYLEQLIENLDEIFKISDEKPYGIYDEIRDEMIQLVNNY